eukprot:968634-Pelagomonas_calceolata.AAC.1
MIGYCVVVQEDVDHAASEDEGTEIIPEDVDHAAAEDEGTEVIPVALSWTPRSFLWPSRCRDKKSIVQRGLDLTNDFAC